MPNILLISDNHFGHANILTFTRQNGAPVRTFSCVEEMDEHMVERWNSVVRPQDKVYHLGDIVMNKPGLSIIGRLNGHKRLIRGNHDLFPLKRYMEYFEEVYATRLIDRMILSHIPIHPESIGKSIANIHGHVHNNVDDMHFGYKYFNVSCEVLDYTPISLEDLKVRLAERLLPWSTS